VALPDDASGADDADPLTLALPRPPSVAADDALELAADEDLVVTTDDVAVLASEDPPASLAEPCPASRLPDGDVVVAPVPLDDARLDPPSAGDAALFDPHATSATSAADASGVDG